MRSRSVDRGERELAEYCRNTGVSCILHVYSLSFHHIQDQVDQYTHRLQML
jgi:hypothetical protein